ncbi:MAG: hypothetical protein GAK30_03782 [Paracidovorax wautersii]|uniref:DUF3108 domain-containing protein n=1 Tax=Paracidovorax wautersii TaxID=1177982 RepID=A0A7V8FKK2_9BURK|nr:MAG: hypothetical protein GAK30_03782 [Paracidovorax wautersii]
MGLMRTLLVFSFALSASLASTLASAAAPATPKKAAAQPRTAAWTLPPNVQLNYALQGRIKGIQYNATSTLQWQQANGNRYSLRLDTRLPLVGTRSQVSEGQIAAAVLQPERYTEQMRRTSTATVSLADRKVTFNTDHPPADWQKGAQDRLSVMLQIGQWLRAQPGRYKPGDVLDVQVIGPRNAPVWHFRVDGTESVVLPTGSVDALKFTRLPRDDRPDDDQVIEFWLAPAYQQLPVRLRWSEDGDSADQMLTGATGLK